MKFTATVAVTGAALCAAATVADGPVASATYTVNGSSFQVTIAGTVLPSGNVSFVHSIAVSPWEITWNYTVDPNPVGNASFQGSTSIKNVGNGSAVTRTTFEVALCPTVISNSFFAGTAQVKLTTDPQGGSITCGPGPHLTGVLVNGTPTFITFWCPFVMSSGGGMAQTSTNFGLPFPSLAGPPSVDSFGHFVELTLTPGEVAQFTAMTVTQGLVSYMPPATCPNDINGDGIVNKWDLIALLAAFGEAGSCLPADLNGDGRVDGADLGLLIGSWGVCPD